MLLPYLFFLSFINTMSKKKTWLLFPCSVSSKSLLPHSKWTAVPFQSDTFFILSLFQQFSSQWLLWNFHVMKLFNVLNMSENLILVSKCLGCCLYAEPLKNITVSFLTWLNQNETLLIYFFSSQEFFHQVWVWDLIPFCCLCLIRQCSDFFIEGSTWFCLPVTGHRTGVTKKGLWW